MRLIGRAVSTRTARSSAARRSRLPPPAAPAGKINLSDLDSRNVKTSRGWVQGYNAQAVATEDQIVIAAEVTVASPDFGHLEPMICAARDELRQIGVEQPPGVVLADAGYWHQVQMERLLGDGLTVLIPPDAKKRAGARPGWDGGLYSFMRRVLDSDAGGELYAKRQTMIEPIFADTKFNRRIDRFLRRGRSAARSEWRLTNAAHNLLKLWRHTTAPRGGLTGRPAAHDPAAHLHRRPPTSPRKRPRRDFPQQPPRDAAARGPSAVSVLRDSCAAPCG